MSDEALLAAFGREDRRAAAVFVRRFQRRVFGLALAVVGDEGRAAEVAQDAFVRAWRHAASFDPRRGSVITWLLTITRNLAIDRRRMEDVRPADPVDPLLLAHPVLHRGPEDAAMAAGETSHVVDALGALPEPQRRCVVLATIGGRTAREISEIEGIPLGTAKTRIRDGLRKVRQNLSATEEARRD
ncbi:MAG: sigma-70 family RNA polymerase sigma factor [Acidimicrobiales bacterium]